MSETISNTEDVLDSRDIDERIEALQEKQQAIAAELETLKCLAAQARDYTADWEQGTTLIRDSYFEEYAQELAKDLGLLPREFAWPQSSIDWERAARELQIDYAAVDFDGVLYWVQ